MKILVLQLARLGDIYQSWPALRALRRKHPQAEIHFLTRVRYAPAVKGLDGVDKVVYLPSQEIFTSLVGTGKDQIPSALSEVDFFVSSLAQEKYDWVINLTFSPLSSYIVHAIAAPEAKISGYTRHADGYLKIPDAMSAYFYAQVGIDRPNRYHLCEIFGTLCEVDLEPNDWKTPALPEIDVELPSEYIAVHVGGSEKHKAISVSKWISVLANLRQLRPIKVVLIGSIDEKSFAEQIKTAAPDGEVQNLAGELSLLKTMAVIKRAKILVGPDSAPIHMAALADTPVLNLSIGHVNYWETGPRSLGSVVFTGKNEDDLPSDQIADMIMHMVQQMRLPFGTITSSPGTPSFSGVSDSESEFTWKLIQAIYMGTEFPISEDPLFYQAMEQLDEANRFMLETLLAMKTAEDLKKKSAFLERGEEIIETIAKLVPALIPIVRWYQTEKIRVGPEPLPEIYRQNLETQRLLQGLIEIYRPATDPTSSPTPEAP